MNSSKKNNYPAITFDDLPKVIGVVLNKLEEIQLQLLATPPETVVKRPVNTKQLCEFLSITEPTVARYRRKGIIPYISIGTAIRYDLSKVVASLESKKTKK
jgi:hypothetical protein